MSKGWYFEPQRHALSSCGVKTTFGKLQQFHGGKNGQSPSPNYNIISSAYTKSEPSIEDYNREVKKFIFDFWHHSINDEWESYPFHKTLSTLKELTENYLIWDLDLETKEKLKHLNRNNVKDFVKSKNTVNYDNYMDKIVEYYNKIEKWEEKTKEEKIFLIDEAIHIQHSMGTLLGGEFLSISQLRQEFEEEYL